MLGSQGSGVCSVARNKAKHGDQICDFDHKGHRVAASLVYPLWAEWLQFSHWPTWIDQQKRIHMQSLPQWTPCLLQYLQLEREWFLITSQVNPHRPAQGWASATASGSCPGCVAEAPSHPPRTLPLKARHHLGSSFHCWTHTSFLPAYFCCAFQTLAQKIKRKSFFFKKR